MANTTPQTSSDVDHILQLGTDLYHTVCFHNNYMLVDDFPATVNIEDRTLSLDMKDPRGGVVSQRVDDLNALTFSLASALKLCFDESNTCLLTVGHYPSYTIGLEKGNDENYLVSDSHSRDDNGKLIPDGRAVIIKDSSIDMLISYVEDMSKSLSTSDMPFEDTAVIITAVDTQTTESPREEIFSTAEIHVPTNANHTQATREEISPAAETSDNSGHTQHTGEEIYFTEETSSNERYTQQSTVQEQQTTASTDTSMDIERTIGIEDITVNTKAPSTVPEIIKFDNNAPNEIKYKLILHREPEATFQFPSKLFCDKRRASGSIKRHWCREWFRNFDFLSYSKIDDGLYCLVCRLFPDTSHRRPTKLISEPYNNWKKQ